MQKRRALAGVLIDIDPDKRGTPYKMPKAIITRESRSWHRPCPMCRLAGKLVCNWDYIIIENLGDIAAALKRNPRHLINKIRDDLFYAQASYDFTRRRAIMEDRVHTLSSVMLITYFIECAITDFIRRFVLCSRCNSPDTSMDENFIFKCNNCSYEFSERRLVNRASGLRCDDIGRLNYARS